MKKILFAIALMAFGTTVSSAQSAAPAKAEKTEKQAKGKKAKKGKAQGASAEKTTYECPMKCEAATDHAGKCGKCGMDLVAVKPKK
jgi:Heavy metal binding domain